MSVVTARLSQGSVNSSTLIQIDRFACQSYSPRASKVTQTGCKRSRVCGRCSNKKYIIDGIYAIYTYDSSGNEIFNSTVLLFDTNVNFFMLSTFLMLPLLCLSYLSSFHRLCFCCSIRPGSLESYQAAVDLKDGMF